MKIDLKKRREKITRNFSQSIADVLDGEIVVSQTFLDRTDHRLDVFMEQGLKFGRFHGVVFVDRLRSTVSSGAEVSG